MKQPKIYNTALYMRLSRDDESYGDSVSIETQRTILRSTQTTAFGVGEYVDDGWSGTNFERPFQRMMEMWRRESQLHRDQRPAASDVSTS